MRLFRRGSAAPRGAADDSQPPAPDGSRARWIVVGLGNPTDRYATTRHNAGAMVLDELCRATGAPLKRHKSGCLIAEVDLSGERAVLARPASYMNESGRPVAALARWFKAGPDRLVVVHDELDVPFGDVRIKVGGGTAGHNGLGSLVSHLGTKDFVRVRVGIGRPRGGRDPTDFVLDRFSGAERKELPIVLGRASEAVESIVAAGPERAMNDFNAR